jgi:hypothetical protein
VCYRFFCVACFVFSNRGRAMTNGKVLIAFLFFSVLPMFPCDCPSDGINCNYEPEVQCNATGDACSCNVVQHTCQLCGTCQSGRCDTCSCHNIATAPHPAWSLDPTLSGQLKASSPALAQIVADEQESAAQGHLCSSFLHGGTVLTPGDASSVVMWRYYDLREGYQRFETDKGEALVLFKDHWQLSANFKPVAKGEIAPRQFARTLEEKLPRR